MIKSFKVPLYPTKEQEEIMWESANISRWAYNWTLGKQKENYENGGMFIQSGDLRKELTQLKKSREYQWLNNVSAQIPKQAVIDACDAYKRFFKGQSKFPRFKMRRKSKPSFYQRYDKLKFKDNKVVLEKIGWVFVGFTVEAEKYSNPRVSYDGLQWWLSAGIEVGDLTISKETTESIGIDLGIKNLAVVSNSTVYKNINKTDEVRRLKKKLKRLQRQASRHYENLKKKRGENRYKKTSNLLKLEKEILKIHKRLNNIRKNHTHQTTSFLVKAKPEFIVLEDLNVSGMMKNKHLSRAVAEQNLHEFKRQIKYKCSWYGVKLIIADRFFPSSKLCSQCGQIKSDLKLSDRKYLCGCGLEIDRDLNASINLRNYGKSVA